MKHFGWLIFNFSASLNYATASKIHRFNLFSSSAVFRCLLLSFCKFQKHSRLPTFHHGVTSSYSFSCAKHLELTALDEQLIVNYHFLKKVHLRSLFPYATDRTIYIFIQDSTLYIDISNSTLSIFIRDSTLYIFIRDSALYIPVRDSILYISKTVPFTSSYETLPFTSPWDSILYIFLRDSTPYITI